MTTLAHPALRFREVLDGIAAPHGAMALARHAPRTGTRALVIDCGAGETSLDLGRLVGPKGNVVGIDGAEEVLEVAVRAARSGRADNVSFVGCPASAHLFDGTWNFAFALFAPAFHDSPRVALAKIRRALAPEGRLVLVTWAELAANAWVEVPWLHARRHISPLSDPAGAAGAGRFSMSEPAAVRAILRDAGYTDVGIESTRAAIVVGRSVEEAVSFQLELGAIGDELRRTGLTRSARDDAALRAALAQAFAHYLTPRGVRMDSSSLCITAKVSCSR